MTKAKDEIRNLHNKLKLIESNQYQEPQEVQFESPVIQEDDESTYRFEEIMGEMQNLLHEAMEIVQHSGREDTYSRARSYWYAHIEGAIDKESSQFMGGSMYDMASTLEELRGNDDRGDEEEYEEGIQEDSTGSENSIKFSEYMKSRRFDRQVYQQIMDAIMDEWGEAGIEGVHGTFCMSAKHQIPFLKIEGEQAGAASGIAEEHIGNHYSVMGYEDNGDEMIIQFDDR